MKAYAFAGSSLVGIGPCTGKPLSFGNYFSVQITEEKFAGGAGFYFEWEENNCARVRNMWFENLTYLVEQGVATFPIECEVSEEPGLYLHSSNSITVNITDSRISPEWFHNTVER